MSTRENQLFDELIRHKLEGYSEPPDMQLLPKIHAKKSRILNWYGIARILFIVSLTGLSLLGNHYYQEILRTGIHPAVQALVPFLQATAASEAAVSGGTKAGSSIVSPSVTLPATHKTNYSSEIKSPAKVPSVVESTKLHSSSPNTNTHKVASPASSQASPVIKVNSESQNQINQQSENKTIGESKSTCASAFEYFKSFTGEFTFTNFSTGEALSYNWDFGDGSRSAEVSPNHQYRRDGHYTVQLTVSSLTGCTHTESKDVFIQTTASKQPVPSSIKGLVRAGSNPVNNAIVELIQTGTDVATAYHYTVRTNASGEFLHRNIKAGHYLIVAYSTPETPQYIKTFWGNEQDLSNAPEVIITSDMDDELSGYTIDLAYRASTTLTANNVQGSDQREVFLFDRNNNIVGKAMMDSKGNIQYDGDINGSFNVIDMKTGKVNGTVNLGNTSGGSTSGGTLSVPQTMSSIGLSPNPASSSVNLSLQSIESEISRVTIRDANGKEMFSSSYASNQGFSNIPIDISKLPGGVYYVIVMLNNGQVISNRLMKSDGNLEH